MGLTRRLVTPVGPLGFTPRDRYDSRRHRPERRETSMHVTIQYCVV
jgi:hypothetical protein